MYRLSARQILGIALLSAIFAAGAVVLFTKLSSHFQPRSAAFSEAMPSVVTDPSLATDEQNNIEVYKAISPGVVSVKSTSYRLDFFGQCVVVQFAGLGYVLELLYDIHTRSLDS